MTSRRRSDRWVRLAPFGHGRGGDLLHALTPPGKRTRCGQPFTVDHGTRDPREPRERCPECTGSRDERPSRDREPRRRDQGWRDDARRAARQASRRTDEDREALRAEWGNSVRTSSGGLPTLGRRH